LTASKFPGRNAVSWSSHPTTVSCSQPLVDPVSQARRRYRAPVHNGTERRIPWIDAR
jgi:hypothetical protein